MDFDKPREILKDFSEEEKAIIADKAGETIFDWVADDPNGAVNLILDSCEGEIDALLDWVGLDGLTDEEVRDILGFWPWKADPIPASEVP